MQLWPDHLPGLQPQPLAQAELAPWPEDQDQQTCMLTGHADVVLTSPAGVHAASSKEDEQPDSMVNARS